MRSILVTGATGYLGSKLTSHLVNEKQDVSVLVRNIDTFSNPNRLPAEKVLDLSFLGANSKKFDCIINCATRYKSEESLDLIHSNIVFPIHVIEKLLGEKGWFVNMDTSLNSNTNIYSKTKSLLVDILRVIAGNTNQRVVNLKLEYFFDENEPKKRFLSSLVTSCIKNETFMLTKGEQVRDFIHMQDLCSAVSTILNSMDKFQKKFTEIDIGLGEAITIKELALLIKNLTDSESKLEFGAIPYRENETMFSQAKPTFLYDLGWQPKLNLKMALTRTIEKLRSK